MSRRSHVKRAKTLRKSGGPYAKGRTTSGSQIAILIKLASKPGAFSPDFMPPDVCRKMNRSLKKMRRAGAVAHALRAAYRGR